ncbi:hypothetical protein [Leeuwenhoekiella nanhaiensis]|uniref:Uncharacterized protein n=1 Tax=Leeuwenhoekiella nanhaiensis TaxID=1655491 RepID=A0A2G1VTS1_9FLAO|nr:hypothetical protein [Leeuwenhoekiella nanhaiensis]PHQ30183.1 hypothetical protein CJ305_04260 [Leeuwenhoekiella nanhaiensis]
MKENNKRKLQRLLEYRNLSYDAMVYSQQRMDLLIISISGAGIYGILESKKIVITDVDILDENLDNLFSWGFALFVFAIIINFVSQYFSYKCHRADYRMYGDEIYVLENPKKKEEVEFEIKELDNIAASSNKITRILNVASILSLFAALILVTIIFLNV